MAAVRSKEILEAPRQPSRLAVWTAYAAAGWAGLFAVLSVYWALGGTAGAETVSPAIVRLARAHDPLTLAALWIAALIKVASAVIALALVQRWGRRIPPALLLLLAWGAGTLLAVHGALYLLVGMLAASGAIHVGTPPAVLRWYTVLWGPWWLLGGLLFLSAGVSYLRRAPDRRRSLAFGALGALGALILLALSGGTIG